MLTMTSYPVEYVSACRERIASDAAAFAKSKAPASLEQPYFRNLLLALELSFVHRTRAIEGKDGNPLNEVRVLTDSMLLHGGVMTPQKSIKLDPASAVLRIAYGEPVELDAESFARLAEAFFAELEAKFVES